MQENNNNQNTDELDMNHLMQVRREKLDKLKQEVQELNPYMQNNLELGMLKVWNNFYNDVINSRKFLYFR